MTSPPPLPRIAPLAPSVALPLPRTSSPTPDPPRTSRPDTTTERALPATHFISASHSHSFLRDAHPPLNIFATRLDTSSHIFATRPKFSHTFPPITFLLSPHTPSVTIWLWGVAPLSGSKWVPGNPGNPRFVNPLYNIYIGGL